MGDLFMAAIAVLAFVVLVALLWSNQKREKENYLTEGMCLGIALGAGLRSLLDMDLGVAISIGMLLGALIGQQVPKKKETNPEGQDQTTEQESQNGDDGSPAALGDENAQVLGKEDDHEKH